MLDSDLLPLPSLRPDGRLDRLNYGGGSGKQKVDRYIGAIDAQKKAGAKDMKTAHNAVMAAQQQKPSAAQQQTASTAPTAPAAQAASATSSPAYTEKKKRRTLLSGQQSLNQENNGTILGAV
jgi:hypothetical protein